MWPAAAGGAKKNDALPYALHHGADASAADSPAALTQLRRARNLTPRRVTQASLQPTHMGTQALHAPGHLTCAVTPQPRVRHHLRLQLLQRACPATRLQLQGLPSWELRGGQGSGPAWEALEPWVYCSQEGTCGGA